MMFWWKDKLCQRRFLHLSHFCLLIPEAVVENSRGITDVCSKLKLQQEVQSGTQMLYKYSRPSFKSAVKQRAFNIEFGFRKSGKGVGCHVRVRTVKDV